MEKKKGSQHWPQAFDQKYTIGRDGRIRTDDPLPPRQMRYQAALRPDLCNRDQGRCSRQTV